MANPLAMFRKHQFVLMVGLVLVAMGSFVIAPSIDEYLRSQSIAESGREDVVVTWQGGQWTQGDFERERMTHRLAVTYLDAIVEETNKRDGTPRGPGVSRNDFGLIVDPGIPRSESPENLLYTALMAKKAESLGMVVSDEAVIEFLELLSDGVLPQSEFGRIFRETLGNRFTQEFLLDRLRTELLAQRMRQTMAAGLFLPPPGAVTPGDAWRYFQRMNRNVEAELVPVSVSNYFDQLPDPPSDEELADTIYREGKDRFVDPMQPEPGFMRRRHGAFQFVKAEFNKFHEAAKATIIDKITSQEIEDYYQENKQKYVIESPAGGDGAEDSTDDSGPSEDTAPASDSPASDSESEEASTTLPKASEDEAEDSSAVESPPEEGAGSSPSTDDQGRLRDGERSALQPVSFQQPAAEGSDVAAEDDGGGASTGEAAAPGEAQESDTSSETPAVVPSTPEGEPTESDLSTDPDAETGDEDSAPEPGIQYRPLDDELREEIRETLTDIQSRQPAQERQDEALEHIRQQIEKFGRQVNRPTSRKRQSTEHLAPIQFADLEPDELLEVGEIPLVDSLGINDYEISDAYRLSWPLRKIQFEEIAFLEGLPLYSPDRISGGDSGVTYLYWKTQNQEPYVPEFSEVKEEVLAAWKKREALSLARQAADQLVAEAKAKKGTSLAEVFAARGNLQVTSTDLFSWMSTGFSPAGTGEPGISNVEGVKGVGPTFMEGVFALEQGEVGTTLNQSEDVVYVVRIASESPTEEILRQRFLTSGVSTEVAAIANSRSMDLLRQWYDDLEAELAVQWRNEGADGTF